MNRNGPLAIAFHCVVVTFILLPLVMVALVSLTPLGYISLPTSGVSFRWYAAVLEQPALLASILRSIQIALISSSVALILGVPVALAIGRHSFTGRGTLNALFMLPIPTPHIVIGVAFLIFLTQIGWNGTITGLVMCHVVLIMPFVLRILLAGITGMDQTIEQAAMSLGATRLVVFRRITLPLMIPAISGALVIAFILSFDELTVALFIASTRTVTFPVWLFDKISWSVEPLITAVSTLLVIAMLVLAFILEKLFGLERLLVGKAR